MTRLLAYLTSTQVRHTLIVRSTHKVEVSFLVLCPPMYALIDAHGRIALDVREILREREFNETIWKVEMVRRAKSQPQEQAPFYSSSLCRRATQVCICPYT